MEKENKEQACQDQEAALEDEKEETVQPQEEQEECENAQQKDQWQDKYVRLCADFDNYKKRTQKELLGAYSNGVCGVIEELLPVVDNLDRAVEAISDTDDSQLAQGIKMVVKQLGEVLGKLQVTPIPALGETFDPNVHNAVMHVEDAEAGENQVVEEFLKGYKVKDKVVRHSMVKVAN